MADNITDVFLVQERYARDVLARFSMVNCKAVSKPLELGCKLDSTQQPKSVKGVAEVERVPYRSAIGSLMYLATCTRPDLAAAVSELSKFSQNPGVAHWEGVERVMMYFKGTVGEGLMYKRGAQLEVWGYLDLGHARDVETTTLSKVRTWGSVRPPMKPCIFRSSKGSWA